MPLNRAEAATLESQQHMIDHLDGQIHALLKERKEIDAALDRRGLFLFAHIDGTFTVEAK